MSDAYYKSVSDLISDRSNVFLSVKRENVTYASMSRLRADFDCVEQLLEYEWDFFVNLCERDFPLKSQVEMKQQLSNQVRYRSHHIFPKRWNFKWAIDYNSEYYSGGKVKNTGC